MLKDYYRLTKPGIIKGNLLTAAAGFLLASDGDINWYRLLAVLAGTALIIGAGCTFNNYIDRDIDAKMGRTKKRALVQGTIGNKQALVFGAALVLMGFAVLALCTNLLTVVIGLTGFIDYVLIYTWAKRHTVYATLIGSISGATAIAAGYTAASGVFDTGALLVFIAMVLWQMPHFYAISIFRRDDYAAAHIPVLSITHGVRNAQIQILAYIAAFMVAVAALTISGVTSYTFAAIMVLLSGVWLLRGTQGFSASNTVDWARKMFLFSLIVMLTLSVMLSVDTWLP